MQMTKKVSKTRIAWLYVLSVLLVAIIIQECIVLSHIPEELADISARSVAFKGGWLLGRSAKLLVHISLLYILLFRYIPGLMRPQTSD